MNARQLNRREFLRTTVAGGGTLVLASTLPVQVAHARAGYFLSDPFLEDLSTQKNIEAGLGGFWVASVFLKSFAHNLNPSNMDLAVLKYLRNAGGEYKTFSEAMKLWKLIPDQIRAAGPEAVQDFLKNKEWSHRVPKSMGGATTAENGIWEFTELNRRRGNRVMTTEEYKNALRVMRSDAIKVALKVTLRGMVRGAVAGIVLAATLSSLEYRLLFARGEISRGELTHRIVSSSIMAGFSSFIVAGLLIGLAMLFPPLILAVAPALLPLQIASFVYLGMRFAVLGKSWYDFLVQQECLSDFCRVLKRIDKILSETLDEVRDDFWGFLEKLTDWVEERPLYVAIEGLFPRGRDVEQAPRIEKTALYFGHLLKEYGYSNRLDTVVVDIRDSLEMMVSYEFEDDVRFTRGVYSRASRA